LAHPAETKQLLPKEPIDVLIDPLKRFLHIEAASGVVLLAVAVVALTLANLPTADWFLSLWKVRLTVGIGSFQMDHSLQHWINDGLMAIFFFVIGLEVKRELTMGELQDLRKAILPMTAAIGGMVVPAGVYLALQWGEPGVRGWGIPMATDIAFMVGCLTILGNRIPNSMRVFLLSLAIGDDIGAILVIAIGYTDSIGMTAILLGILGIAAFPVLSRLGVRNQPVYYIVMLLTWVAFHESGVHATIAGVIFGLLMPAKSWVNESRLETIVSKTRHFLMGGGWQSSGQHYAMLRQMERATRKSISPLERHETELHSWVGFLIMPVFALANAGVPIEVADLVNPVALATALGLFVGKPAGIFVFSWLSVKTGIARLPEGVNWGALLGGGCLAGIGFTMALFISSLALSGDLLDAAKVGIMAGSALSAVAGVSLLIIFLPKPSQSEADTRK
jgi:NhaA family Na+:H+ antiporter